MYFDTTEPPLKQMVRLKVNGHHLDVTKLGELGFEISEELPETDNDTLFQGHLIGSAGEELNISFRIRSSSPKGTKFRFHDQTLSKQAEIKGWIAKVSSDSHGGGDSLAGMSYDQLASGQDDDASPSTEADSPSNKSANPLKKVLALLAVILILLGIGVTMMVFIKSKSQIEVANAALLGNYVPVTALSSGVVVDIMAEEGALVQEGQSLFQIKNDQLEVDRVDISSELSTAKVELAAFDSLIADHNARLKVAILNLKSQEKEASAELREIDAEYSTAARTASKIAALSATGALARDQAEEALQEQASLLAQMEAQEARVEMIQQSYLAASEDGVLVVGDRIQNTLGEYEMKQAVAAAKVDELSKKLTAIGEGTDGIKVIAAPRGGRVISIYRGAGQFVDEDDEILSLSLSEDYWAVGHVSQHNAESIRPGHLATIQVPSLDLKLEGEVVAVGHRAVYSKDGWSQDFRGQALSVPIKVRLMSPSKELPSGLRLQMTVMLGIKWPWTKDEEEGEDLSDLPQSPPLVTTP